MNAARPVCLHIIEPLASRGMATARYLIASFFRFRFTILQRFGVPAKARPCCRIVYAAYATPATSTRISRLVRNPLQLAPIETSHLKLHDGHTTTVLINHELQTHRRLESSLNALAATVLHVRPSLKIAFAFQDRGRRERNLKNHKLHALAMTFMPRFLRSECLGDCE